MTLDLGNRPGSAYVAVCYCNTPTPQDAFFDRSVSW